MDPINVDFGGNKKKVVQDTPKGSTVKKVLLSLVITLVSAAVLYYFMLPALNFKAVELYIYLAVVILIYIAAFGIITRAYFHPEYTEYAKKSIGCLL